MQLVHTGETNDPPSKPHSDNFSRNPGVTATDHPPDAAIQMSARIQSLGTIIANLTGYLSPVFIAHVWLLQRTLYSCHL